jgi:hypothetical protein
VPVALEFLSVIGYLSTMQQSFQPLPWVRSTNIYEVNLRQYTPEGSFRAFRSEMPRLREMGVEVRPSARKTEKVPWAVITPAQITRIPIPNTAPWMISG